MNFFEWLQNTSLAITVGEVWFPWVESAHVVFLAAVAGTIFVVDARLLGWASHHLRFSYLSERLLPWTWIGFGGAVITGLLMFIANASSYVSKAPFLIKMGLLLLAGLNMLFFQFVTYKNVGSWDSAKAPPAARAAGIISMTCWIGVIAFGRWIGFV